MFKVTILDAVVIDAVADLEAVEITIDDHLLKAIRNTELTSLVFFISAKTGSPIVDVDPEVRKTRPDGTTFWSKISKGTGVADYVQLNIDTPSANDYFFVDLPRMGHFDRFRFSGTATTLNASNKFTADAWLEIAKSIRVSQ